MRDSFFQKEKILKEFYEDSNDETIKLSASDDTYKSINNRNNDCINNDDSNSSSDSGSSSNKGDKSSNSNNSDNDITINNHNLRNWPKTLNLKTDNNENLSYVLLWIVVNTFLLTYPSDVSYWYRWIVVCMIVACVAVSSVNGFDSLELLLHGNMILQDYK